MNQTSLDKQSGGAEDGQIARIVRLETNMDNVTSILSSLQKTQEEHHQSILTRMDYLHHLALMRMDDNKQAMLDRMDRNHQALLDKVDRDIRAMRDRMERGFDRANDRIDRSDRRHRRDMW